MSNRFNRPRVPQPQDFLGNRERILPAFVEPGGITRPAVTSPAKLKQQQITVSQQANSYVLYSQVEYRHETFYTVANASTLALDFNPNRKSLLIQNTGLFNINVTFTLADNVDTGLIILAGTQYQFPYPTPQEIFIYATVASIPVRLIESV